MNMSVGKDSKLGFWMRVSKLLRNLPTYVMSTKEGKLDRVESG